MPYPPAPWTLQGYSLQTVNLVDVDKARRFIPSALEMISVLPGKTVGGLYISHYGPGSTLEYNELIVVAGLTRRAGKIGAWISHIYVDNPDSVAGGREIWGLPKELAEFHWHQSGPGSVTVQQGSQVLCRCTRSWDFGLWRQSLMVPSFSQLQGTLLQFIGQTTAKLELVGAGLDIPADSPFADLGVSQPWLAIQSRDLELVAKPPEVVTVAT